MNAVEAELTARLASPAAARAAARGRVEDLLRRVDSAVYTARLAERGLLVLLGSRAIEMAPEAVDELLRARVQAGLRQTHLQSLPLEMTLRRAVGALEDRGIPALPLKGTTLADRLYSDVGMRPTTDVDLLVPRAQILEAVGTLMELGYPAPDDAPWTDGLPELHYRLEGDDAAMARVELHWRVHWSEREFSEEALRTATVGQDGLRRAEPAHELALLLLFFARDGLHAPRLAADIATWWDKLGDRVGPGPLDGIAARHPSLRRSLVAALASLERSVGVPARAVLTDMAADRSTRFAIALADPLRLDATADVFATLMLVDALLCTGRDKLGFFRRYVLQPLPYVRRSYDMRDAPVLAVAGRGAVHGAGTLIKRLPRMIRVAIGARRRRSTASA